MSNTLTLDPHRDDHDQFVSKDQLFVVLQGDRPNDGSSRHLLDNIDLVVIGRGDTRSVERKQQGKQRVLELRFPDLRMSAMHARISKSASGYVFEDAGSKNGSRLDGTVVGTAPLSDGSILELGLTTFLLRRGLSSPADSAEDVLVRPPVTAFSTLLPATARAFDGLSRVAHSNLPIMLLGETGTGKELFARTVHSLSGRSGEFVAVNCAALPQALVEATLFGHKRGAYSGAVTDNPGLVRAAEGGSLLLDEVGDLPLAAQGALLRTLQEREVLPVGASRAIPVDVRILAATHRPMGELVANGQMREDLYARLAGFVLTLPALRERREDLGLLVAALLAKKANDGNRSLTLASGTMAALLRYDWPRNIRELETWIWRSDALHADGVLRPETLRDETVKQTAADSQTNDSKVSRNGSENADQLRTEVETALTKYNGNLAAVASSFRTSRSQVHRWLKRFNLKAQDFRS